MQTHTHAHNWNKDARQTEGKMDRKY